VAEDLRPDEACALLGGSALERRDDAYSMTLALEGSRDPAIVDVSGPARTLSGSAEPWPSDVLTTGRNCSDPSGTYFAARAASSLSLTASHRSASRAAMQPVPAAVTAWR